MITGADELDLAYLSEKMGSLALSTNCCGTGTCDDDDDDDDEYLASVPNIDERWDTDDARQLAEAFGPARA